MTKNFVPTRFGELMPDGTFCLEEVWLQMERAGVKQPIELDYLRELETYVVDVSDCLKTVSDDPARDKILSLAEETHSLLLRIFSTRPQTARMTEVDPKDMERLWTFIQNCMTYFEGDNYYFARADELFATLDCMRHGEM